jgi:ribonucleoside-diphosphate reductase alpha chain
MKKYGMMNLDGRETLSHVQKGTNYIVEKKKINKILTDRGIIDNSISFEEVINEILTVVTELDFILNSKVTNIDFVQNIRDYIDSSKLIIGTPILKNVRKEHKDSAAACTVFNPHISDGSINIEHLKNKLQLFLGAGIGVGLDLSECKDPLFELRRIDDILFDLDNELKNKRKRPVAVMITLRVSHPEVINFIQAKKHIDFSKSRVNISIFTEEKLFSLAENDENFPLFNQNGQVEKLVKAKYLIELISEAAHYCGEPGVLFIDRFEKENSTPNHKFISTAPCAEIAMSSGDACHFSYINLSEFVISKKNNKYFDFNSFGKCVRSVTRFLDSIVEYTIQNEFFKRSLVAKKRRIGVGILGFATMLVKLNLDYDSKESILLASQIAEYLNFYSKKESNILAQKRGAFELFSKSAFIDKIWKEKKRNHFTGIISETDWNQLFKDIEKYGIRNASTVAFPPTGTSSMIAMVSPSFEPYFSVYENYFEKGKKYSFLPSTLYSAIKSATNNNEDKDEKSKAHNQLLKQSKDIDFINQILITKSFQDFADGGASKTVHLPNKASVEDVYSCFYAAYQFGLKGISIFRENCINERKKLVI